MPSVLLGLQAMKASGFRDPGRRSQKARPNGHDAASWAEFAAISYS
jgi:hypothetical protein